MFFFCKPSQIVIDCFTTRNTVYETAKPQRAATFIPDWWRKLPKTMEIDFIDRPTMRSCRGFLDLYATGFIQPMWSDVSILALTPENCGVTFADSISKVDMFHQWQRGTFMQDKLNLMLLSPWKMKEKTGVKFHTSGCYWNTGENKDFVTPPAILDFKYQNACHVNIMININENVKLIEFGTPMVHYVPISDKKINLKHHLVSETEFERQVGYRSIKFKNNYQVMKKARCPVQQ